MSDDTSFAEKTIEHLSPLVDSPALTVKLLSRPPYRFIFDVVRTIQKKTGFGDGLFTDDELESGKPAPKGQRPTTADRNRKISFLNKMIKVSELVLKKPCPCDPRKVISGNEPENTNLLLNMFYDAATKVGNKSASLVAQINGTAPPEQENPKARPKQAEESSKPKPKPKAAPKPKPEEKPAEEEKPKPRQRPPKQEPEPQEEEEKPRRRRENPPASTSPRQSPEDRPTSKSHGRRPARRPPSEEDEEESNRRDRESAAAAQEKAQALEQERERMSRRGRQRKRGGGDDEDETTMMMNDGDALGFGMQPPSQPSNQRKPGLRRGMMEDSDSEPESDDAVDAAMAQVYAPRKNDSNEPKSKLAQEIEEQARLHQGDVKETDNPAAKAKLQEEEAKRDEQIATIRDGLQEMVKSILPLGRVDYLQSDLETMSKEFNNARKENLQHVPELDKAKRDTDDELHPLLAQLCEVNQNVIDTQRQISHLRSQIQKNDETIASLMRNIMSPKRA